MAINVFRICYMVILVILQKHNKSHQWQWQYPAILEDNERIWKICWRSYWQAWHHSTWRFCVFLPWFLGLWLNIPTTPPPGEFCRSSRGTPAVWSLLPSPKMADALPRAATTALWRFGMPVPGSVFRHWPGTAMAWIRWLSPQMEAMLFQAVGISLLRFGILPQASVFRHWRDILMPWMQLPSPPLAFTLPQLVGTCPWRSGMLPLGSAFTP